MNLKPQAHVRIEYTNGDEDVFPFATEENAKLFRNRLLKKPEVKSAKVEPVRSKKP